MKRQSYQVRLWQQAGLVSEETAFAHNSGVRRSEGLARAYAREHGVILHGDRAERSDLGYVRRWATPDGEHEVYASVSPQHS